MRHRPPYSLVVCSSRWVAVGPLRNRGPTTGCPEDFSNAASMTGVVAASQSSAACVFAPG
jgi:hypothetical protein